MPQQAGVYMVRQRSNHSTKALSLPVTAGAGSKQSVSSSKHHPATSSGKQIKTGGGVIAAVSSTATEDKLMTYLTLNMRKLFKSHGEFCASQPWEVIVTTITFLVCLLTVMGKQSLFQAEQQLTAATAAAGAGDKCGAGQTQPAIGDTGSQMENIVMTLIRCLAVLHCYYRFKKIHRIGSAFIMKIAASYLAFTLVLFLLIATSLGPPSSMKVRLLYDSWFMVLLLMDMQRVSRMAQFALCSSHHRRISENIAHGMYVLAPTFSLDTLIKVMLMGMGSLTGIAKLEVYAWYAVIFNLVNFIVYMTFFPAGLSLILELMYCHDGRPRWNVKEVIQTLPSEESTSPVVHKVRMFGSVALLVLHIVYHRPPVFTAATLADHIGDLSVNNYSTIRLLIYLFFYNLEQIILISVLMVLSVKYLLFEDRLIDEAQSLRQQYIEELTRTLEMDKGSGAEDHEGNAGTQNGTDEYCDHGSNSTDEGISVSAGTESIVSASVSVVAGRREAAVAAAAAAAASSSSQTLVSNGQIPRCLVSDQDQDQSSTDSSWSNVTAPPEFKDREAQTTDFSSDDVEEGAKAEAKPPRSLDECVKIVRNSPEMVPTLTDDELLMLLDAKHIRSHSLEKTLNNDYLRGVDVRRKYVSRSAKLSPAILNQIPFRDYDYKTVMGACAESVIGFMTLPLGAVGPLKIDGKLYTVPMATTEGCLVASTNRGCSALREGGVTAYVTDDGMSRAPCLRFSNVAKAVEAKAWIEAPENYQIIKQAFDSQSRFARLQRLRCRLAGRLLYLRFVAKTGDAMGMNMLGKGVEHTLNKMYDYLPDMTIVSVSGNVCTDKKPAAVNWVEGRGKSVVCEAIIPKRIVHQTLKTNTADLCELNNSKNLIGSAMAGSIGGYNAHAANIVTAIYIATGQDAAQNVGSSNCMTLMEPWGPDGRDLFISCTMPSVEVGTVGGGTVLAAQSACLEMLGVKGSHPTQPGDNARQLAKIVCATVLAGELSLMSALAAGHLVKSHLRHNRSTAQFGASTSAANMTRAATAVGGSAGATAAPAASTSAAPSRQASDINLLASSTLCGSNMLSPSTGKFGSMASVASSGLMMRDLSKEEEETKQKK